MKQPKSIMKKVNVQQSTKKETRNLKTELNDKQMKEQCQNLSVLLQEGAQEKEAKKTAMKEYDQRIQTISEKVAKCADTIKAGYKLEEVECDVIKDFNKGDLKVIRLDDGSTIEERKLAKEESQMEFQGLEVALPVESIDSLVDVIENEEQCNAIKKEASNMLGSKLKESLVDVMEVIQETGKKKVILDDVQMLWNAMEMEQKNQIWQILCIAAYLELSAKPTKKKAKKESKPEQTELKEENNED